MATIFTVHGTNASGPEEGTSWWQRGSPFQRHVRELVEPVSGELKFQPIVWDGENSESSRRHAANALLGFMRSAEQANEPYCVIGHSHGGSVIANALLQGVVRKNSFQGLKQWITVGTPFSWQAPWPASAVAAGTLPPCARITARPRVSSCQTSAIVRAARSRGCHPSSRSDRLCVTLLNRLLPVMPWTPGFAPVAIVE